MLLQLDIDFFNPVFHIMPRTKAAYNSWENISALDSCMISLSWLNNLWLFLGLFRREVHPSFIHMPLDEPRMTIQPIILFHKITNLTELCFFSDHMVIVKIHAIICRSESQRISVALESKWLIIYNQIIFPQLCTTWFLLTCTNSRATEWKYPQKTRDT